MFEGLIFIFFFRIQILEISVETKKAIFLLPVLFAMLWVLGKIPQCCRCHMLLYAVCCCSKAILNEAAIKEQRAVKI